jgi:2-dehydropantoate 2-reductase
LHLNETQGLSFGERHGGRSTRVESIQSEFAHASFDSYLSENILQAMWEKWVFIASLAGVTCLMRAAVGDVLAAGSVHWPIRIYEECEQIAADAGFPPGQSSRELSLRMLTTSGSKLTASMLRDIEGGGRTEVEQILGDLLSRRKSDSAEFSILGAALLHVRSYEKRRERELGD